ncbi:hypothetical protein DSECCO2_655820 [anaerobic digester metagenome]
MGHKDVAVGDVACPNLRYPLDGVLRVVDELRCSRKNRVPSGLHGLERIESPHHGAHRVRERDGSRASRCEDIGRSLHLLLEGLWVGYVKIPGIIGQ